MSQINVHLDTAQCRRRHQLPMQYLVNHCSGRPTANGCGAAGAAGAVFSNTAEYACKQGCLAHNLYRTTKRREYPYVFLFPFPL